MNKYINAVAYIDHLSPNVHHYKFEIKFFEFLDKISITINTTM